jgi:hypothetical protein
VSGEDWGNLLEVALDPAGQDDLEYSRGLVDDVPDRMRYRPWLGQPAARRDVLDRLIAQTNAEGAIEDERLGSGTITPPPR